MCTYSGRTLKKDIQAIENRTLPYLEEHFPGSVIDSASLNIACPCECAIGQASGADYNKVAKKLDLNSTQARSLRVLATGSQERCERRYAEMTEAWQHVLVRNPQFAAQQTITA